MAEIGTASGQKSTTSSSPLKNIMIPPKLQKKATILEGLKINTNILNDSMQVKFDKYTAFTQNWNKNDKSNIIPMKYDDKLKKWIIEFEINKTELA